MRIILDEKGNVIEKTSNSWADKHNDVVIEYYYSKNLKVALKARNERKRELQKLGWQEIKCQPFIDDEVTPHKTLAYIISAAKAKILGD